MSNLLVVGQAAADLARTGQPLTRDALRRTGVSDCGHTMLDRARSGTPDRGPRPRRRGIRLVNLTASSDRPDRSLRTPSSGG